MSNVVELVFKGDASGAISAVSSIESALGSLLKYGSMGAALGLAAGGAKALWSGIGAGVDVVGKGIGAAAQAYGGFINEAIQTEQLEITFGRLAKSVGVTDKELLNITRTASRGTLSQQSLYKSSNKLIQMGIAKTAQQTGQHIEAATQLGAALGLDASTSMDKWMSMMANRSIRLADDFGLSISDLLKRRRELVGYEGYAFRSQEELNDAKAEGIQLEDDLNRKLDIQLQKRKEQKDASRSVKMATDDRIKALKEDIAETHAYNQELEALGTIDPNKIFGEQEAWVAAIFEQLPAKLGAIGEQMNNVRASQDRWAATWDDFGLAMGKPWLGDAETGLRGLLTVVTDTFKEIEPSILGVNEKIVGALTGLVPKITPIIQELAGAFTDWVDSPEFQAGLDKFVEGLDEFVEKVADFAERIPGYVESIAGFLGDLATGIGDFYSSFMEAYDPEAIDNMLSTLENLVNFDFGTGINLWEGAGRQLGGAVTEIANSITEAAAEIDAAITYFKTVWEGLSEIAGLFGRVLAGESIWDVADEYQAAAEKVHNAGYVFAKAMDPFTKLEIPRAAYAIEDYGKLSTGAAFANEQLGKTVERVGAGLVDTTQFYKQLTPAVVASAGESRQFGIAMTTAGQSASDAARGATESIASVGEAVKVTAADTQIAGEAIKGTMTSTFDEAAGIIETSMEGVNTSVTTQMSLIRATLDSEIALLTTGVETAFTTLGTSIDTSFATIGTSVQTAMVAMTTEFTNGMTAVGAAWSLAWSQLTQSVAIWMQQIAFTIQAGMFGIQTALTMAFVGVQMAWSLAWNQMMMSTQLWMQQIVFSIQAGMINIQTALTTAMMALQMAWSLAWSQLVMSTQTWMQQIAFSVQAGMLRIQTAMIMGMTMIRAAWSAAWAAMQQTANIWMGQIVAAVTSGMARMRAAITSAMAAARAQWASAWSQMKAIVSTAVNQMQGAISKLVQSLGTIGPAASAAAGALRSVASAAGSIVSAAGRAASAVRNLSSAISSIPKMALPGSPSPLEKSFAGINTQLERMSSIRSPDWGSYFGGASSGGETHNHFQLVINTSASTEPIISDFQIMQSLAGL